MKINPINPFHLNRYKNQMEKRDKTKDSTKADEIQISTEAKELQKGNRIEAERQAKVEDLKQKVATGEYKVHPEKIAIKMYEFWNQ